MLVASLFITSCSFDGPGIKVRAKINEHYYVLEDASANYGLQIGYSHDTSDANSFQILSSHTGNIYCNRDTIMYNNADFAGSNSSVYYIIAVNPTRSYGLANDPVQIKEAVFKENQSRLTKVNVPGKGGSRVLK